MDNDAPSGPREPRLNPFVFPSDTDMRFVLLMISVLGSSLFVFNLLYFTFSGSRFIEASARCMDSARAAHPINGVGATAKSPAAVHQQAAQGLAWSECMDPLEQTQVLWVFSGVALLLAAAFAIYWAMPALKVRRDRLVPLTDGRAPGVPAYLRELCREAGLPRQPSFLVNPRNASPSGLAFGRRGRRHVSLNVGLVMKFYADRPTFRAVVLHELAHLRNADVDKAYFSVAIGVAFTIVAVLPFAVRSVYDAVVWGEAVFGVTWRVLALMALVYLTLAAVLRARELYADVRASAWDGPSGALARALIAQPRSGGSRWRALRRFHPDSERRRRAITATEELFRMGFWDAFATGATGMLAVPTLSHVLGLLLPNSLAHWSEPLTVLLVGPLAVGVLVLGVWRGAFAALARGENPRGTEGLGVGLGLGIIVGAALSLDTATRTPTNDAWISSLGTTTAHGLFALLAALLLVGLICLVRWISIAASAWLEVVTTRRSLRLIVWLGLTATGLVSTMWLSFLLGLFRTPGSSSLYVDVSSLAHLRSPYVLLALAALWGFPMAASLWRGRESSSPAAQWAFLDPAPPALTLRHRNRFRVSRASMAGAVGGALFCALLIIAEFWWTGLPESVGNAERAKLAFFFGQVAAAAVVQATVAAAVAIRVMWLGVPHGQFAAFVAGCLMVAGMLGINAAFGSTIDASFAWLIFTMVMNAGALLALPVSGAASASARWIRRNRPKPQVARESS